MSLFMVLTHGHVVFAQLECKEYFVTPFFLLFNLI
jgi:hypothetical protein